VPACRWLGAWGARSPSEDSEQPRAVGEAAGISPQKQNFCFVFIFSLFDKQTEILETLL